MSGVEVQTMIRSTSSGETFADLFLDARQPRWRGIILLLIRLVQTAVSTSGFHANYLPSAKLLSELTRVNLISTSDFESRGVLDSNY